MNPVARAAGEFARLGRRTPSLAVMRRAAAGGEARTPCSAFGAVLEQRVAELERQVAELRTRQFSLVFVVVGGVVLAALSRWLP